MLCKRYYNRFDAPDATPGSKSLPTGIRYKGGEYYITFNYVSANGVSQAYVYKGSKDDTHKSRNWYPFSYPSSEGQTVTVTALYGPDVISEAEVQLVGNYNTEESGNPIGCLYQGKMDGSGVWTTLIPTPDTTEVIAHSVDKNIVVGNYIGEIAPAKAFIYNIQTKQYLSLTFPNSASTTAYGVWYNGNNNYTICGGYSNLDSGNLDVGYVVDYNSITGLFENWTSYYYNNDEGASASHFNGISPNCDEDGYYLTGVAIVGNKSTPFKASIARRRDSSFRQKARWENITVPKSQTSTGNSIYSNTIIGIYQNSVGIGATTHGYISGLC